MFIFRVEHKREFCSSDARYSVGGSSLTGHGTFKKCANFDRFGGLRHTPNFGLYGLPPFQAMMVHERCAVTVEQWRSWVGPDSQCRNVNGECYSYYCQCPPVFEVNLGDEWHVVCYWVDDKSEGIDWRVDNGQIVFNPAFAENMGTVSVSEVFEMQDA